MKLSLFLGLQLQPTSGFRERPAGPTQLPSHEPKIETSTSKLTTTSLEYGDIVEKARFGLVEKMGNDGGSIPKRRELVKSAAQPPSSTEVKATQQEALAHAWEQCPVSNTALVAPIVSDGLGVLYNKESIISFLLQDVDEADENAAGARRKEQEAVLGGRIKALRDVVEVHFEEEDEAEGLKDQASTESGNGSSKRQKICPITRKALGVHTRAVYLVPCGHAFSEVAVREMRSAECGICGGAVNVARDVIPVLAVREEEKQRLRQRLRDLEEAGLSHSLKKRKAVKTSQGERKKRKKQDMSTEERPTTETCQEVSLVRDEVRSQTGPSTPNDTRINATVPSANVTRIKNAATASLTARVLEEQQDREKKRQKLAPNDNLQSLFSRNPNATIEGARGGADFMTRGFAIPKNR